MHTPSAPAPDHWRNIVHFSETIKGLIRAAEEFLPRRDFQILLTDVTRECERLEALRTAPEKPVSLGDLCDAMAKAIAGGGRVPAAVWSSEPPPVHCHITI